MIDMKKVLAMSAELERKDAAIDELVQILKDVMPELSKYALKRDLVRAEAAIAKHDNTTKETK